MLSSLLPICGIGVVLAVAWALSEDRRAVPWRTVAGGMALQLALALVLIGFPPATRAVLALNDAVHALQTATDAGTRFVFGYLGGGELPFTATHPQFSGPSSHVHASSFWHEHASAHVV